MLTRSAKNKGARLQKWTAEKISVLTGIPCGKDCLIQSREMGQGGVDVKILGEAFEKFSYAVECKNCEQYSMPAWIKQAKSNCVDGVEFLLVTKRNHEDPLITLDAEVFFKILGNKI
jgi:hypothetical protein